MSRFPSTKSTQWKAISARPSVTLDIIRNLPCQRFSEDPLKHHRHHELSPTMPCISAGADYFENNFFQFFLSNKRSSAFDCKHHQNQNHQKWHYKWTVGMCSPGFTGIHAVLLLPKKNAQVSFRPFSCKKEFCKSSIYQVSE